MGYRADPVSILLCGDNKPVVYMVVTDEASLVLGEQEVATGVSADSSPQLTTRQSRDRV